MLHGRGVQTFGVAEGIGELVGQGLDRRGCSGRTCPVGSRTWPRNRSKMTTSSASTTRLPLLVFDKTATKTETLVPGS